MCSRHVSLRARPASALVRVRAHVTSLDVRGRGQRPAAAVHGWWEVGATHTHTHSHRGSTERCSHSHETPSVLTSSLHGHRSLFVSYFGLVEGESSIFFVSIALLSPQHDGTRPSPKWTAVRRIPSRPGWGKLTWMLLLLLMMLMTMMMVPGDYCFLQRFSRPLILLVDNLIAICRVFVVVLTKLLECGLFRLYRDDYFFFVICRLS